jgi:hypothetical protein
MTDAREMLRHTLATLAYRGGKALRGAPPGFDTFRAGPGSRAAGEILAHVCDLLDWALLLADGRQAWSDSGLSSWEQGSQRFFEALRRFDERLASDAPLACTPEALFQGPVADALTHVGQIALLRRMAGARRARPCAARTTSRPRSWPAASASSRPRRAASSTSPDCS